MLVHSKLFQSSRSAVSTDAIEMDEIALSNNSNNKPNCRIIKTNKEPVLDANESDSATSTVRSMLSSDSFRFTFVL